MPKAFLNRQYRRFHAAMAEHLGRCLQNGVPADQLMEGLREVLSCMGVASFEADYMLNSVQAQQPQAPNSVEDFERQLTTLQQDHQRRMQVLQTLPNLAQDVREQLIEAEERRFQASLFGNGQ